MPGRHNSRFDSPLRLRFPLSNGVRQAAANSRATRRAISGGATLTLPSRYRNASERRTGLGSPEITRSSRPISEARLVTCPAMTSALTGHEDTVTMRFGSVSSFAAENASSIADLRERSLRTCSAAMLNAWQRNQGSSMLRARTSASAAFVFARAATRSRCCVPTPIRCATIKAPSTTALIHARPGGGSGSGVRAHFQRLIAESPHLTAG